MCEPNHIFWVFMVIATLNGFSNLFDWLAKKIPGETDDKIFAALKKILSNLQRIIDFFTARGKR